MNLYLDDNINKGALANRLRKAGHSVVLPAAVGLAGAIDSRHFLHAIEQQRVLLTKDHEDFFVLHRMSAPPRDSTPAFLPFAPTTTLAGT